MNERKLVGRFGIALIASSVLTLGLGACGSDSTAPPERNNPGPPTLARVAAPIAVDTIDAEPVTPYVLALANGDGAPLVGTTVTFNASNAEVASPGGAFGASHSLLTDSRGEVAVVIRYGSLAGAGSLVASTTVGPLADTLVIDVQAGATVGQAITPGDTAVIIGVPFSVSVVLEDRHGNSTGDPQSVSVEFGPLMASGSDFVGTGVGEARLSVAIADSTAVATVRVVPDGELVYTRGTEAWLARFDGSGAELLGFAVPPVGEPSVSWNPAGTRIVLGGSPGFVVFDLDTQTLLPDSWPGGLAGSGVLWPRFGPGGTVYYSSSDGQGAWDLRQMNPDGTSAAITIASDRFPNNDFFPDWAPDGSQFVFTADWEQRNRFLLRLSDPTATTITTIDIEGVTHVWSPDGALIAYQELGVVGVVAPDQSISRSWNPGWSKGVTWSPQSDMLLGISGGQIAIIDVETGGTVVLTHFPTVNAVAWRP